MALLFGDPLAFRPDFTSSSASALRTLVQNWNQTNAGLFQSGTFQRPLQQGQIDQQLEQLEQIRTRMENLQPEVKIHQDRTVHSRRIKQQSGAKSQLLEPIPVMDLDHPLNSWMLNNNPGHLGPLATKNNSDWPILPRFIVSTLTNGTLVQLPVSLYTAINTIVYASWCLKRRQVDRNVWTGTGGRRCLSIEHPNS